MLSLSKVILIGALNSAGLQPVDIQPELANLYTNEESTEILKTLSTEEEFRQIRNFEMAISSMTDEERNFELRKMIQNYGQKLKMANAPWAM